VTGVTTPGGTSLARVTIAAPKRRMDVALPDTMLVAELLPHLLRHADDDLAEGSELHGGWVLRKATGAVLEPARNLAVQGVKDGELLHLTPRRDDWPELAYDDVVEVIARGARRAGRSWGGPATRRCGLAIGAAALVFGLGGALLAGPPWPPVGWLCLGAAAVLTVVGILLSRALADASAGAAVAAAALPYAFLGGTLLAAPGDVRLTDLGPAGLLLGSAALLVFAAAGYTGVAAVLRLFMAGIAAAVTGLLAALLSLAGVSTAGAAAVTLVVAIGLLPSYPIVASWLGRLPVPDLPSKPEDILADRPVPRRTDVFAAVARSSELLTGMLLSAAVTSAIAIAFLVTLDGTPAGVFLSLAGVAALLLRARLFAMPQQRVPLLVGGLAGLATIGFAWALQERTTAAALTALAGTVAVAAIAVVAGLVYSRATPSPYVGRAADILDVLAIMALIPLACAVIGIFGAVRDMFATFGG
jgi:type VII secretion integral membrane protein EccD